MKLVREVADNIKALWHNFQTNVKAVTGLLGEALTLLGEAADAFQRMIRPVLIAVFGDDVGGALADGILLVLGNEALRADLENASRKRVESTYNWANTAQCLLNGYEKILKQNKSRNF